MVSILPSERTPFDVIGRDVGRALQNVLPQAAMQRAQREVGMSSIDQLQNQLQSANGDISKMLPAIARAYTLNPGLERSGLGQFALQNARAKNIYGEGARNQPLQMQSNQPSTALQPNKVVNPNYNILTPEQIDAKAKQDAIITGDPQRYQQSIAEQETLNNISKGYKSYLEGLAKRENIPDDQLRDFMEIGAQYDSSNPEQWLKDTRNAYAPIRRSMDALETAFIPGSGSALIGVNRDENLKRITPTVQDLVKMGREKQVREYLASQWLSNTEIEEQIHPLDKRQEIAINRLPKGIFPPSKKADYSDVVNVFKGKLPESKTTPFVSYDEAKEKDPKAIQVMQDRLADFFQKNVNDDVSLSVLANKIWEDKDYDWRQIGPAIRQAEKNGLKLNESQKAEMVNIESQPPLQSLPDMFKDWWRFIQGGLRGEK